MEGQRIRRLKVLVTARTAAAAAVAKCVFPSGIGCCLSPTLETRDGAGDKMQEDNERMCHENKLRPEVTTVYSSRIMCICSLLRAGQSKGNPGQE